MWDFLVVNEIIGILYVIFWIKFKVYCVLFRLLVLIFGNVSVRRVVMW